jgi:hypothetical protein
MEAEWKIEQVERYYYFSGRNQTTYIEITFWYNPITLERKEKKRNITINDGEKHKLPDWARIPMNRNRSLEYDH